MKGYIRIDAGTSASKISQDKILQLAKKRLEDGVQKGIDFIEFVEVIYQDPLGNIQKLLVKVENKNVIISP